MKLLKQIKSIFCNSVPNLTNIKVANNNTMIQNSYRDDDGGNFSTLAYNIPKSSDFHYFSMFITGNDFKGNIIKYRRVMVAKKRDYYNSFNQGIVMIDYRRTNCIINDNGDVECYKGIYNTEKCKKCEHTSVCINGKSYGKLFDDDEFHTIEVTNDKV